MHVEEHIEDVQDVLRRDPCVSTPDITHADIAAKHTNFRVPEHGLITRGDEDTGERLVGPYTEALADEYALTEEEKTMIRELDWIGMIHYGVIFFNLEKLAPVVGLGNIDVYAAMKGMSVEDFQKTRNAAINYSVEAEPAQ